MTVDKTENLILGSARDLISKVGSDREKLIIFVKGGGNFNWRNNRLTYSVDGLFYEKILKIWRM